MVRETYDCPGEAKKVNEMQRKKTVKGVVKLISQMVYIRLNSFVQCGHKIADDFS